MGGGRRDNILPKSGWKLAVLFLAFNISAKPVLGLKVGINANPPVSPYADGPAPDVRSSVFHIPTDCSRKCESQHCLVPPLLRYGKYCGVLYSGCPGEEPCDDLDACCLRHDACIEAHRNDYLNEECNEKFLECIGEFRDSGGPSFEGNTCNVPEVVDLISLVIKAAIWVGDAHP